jgi:2-keto-myo-inositol isomerase
MKLALNGATTMKADLVTDLRAADAAGFDFLEIWAPKLRSYLQTHSAHNLRRMFDETELEPLSINSIEHVTFRSPADYQVIQAECEELSSLASELRCPYIVVVPGRLPAEAPSLEEIIDESVRVLIDLSTIAERHGIALAFEFLGQTDCSVQTLELADEIVQRVDRPNVGLVIDSFHYYAGGSNSDMIATLDPESLFVFHINDAENLPREQLNDSHRLLPGLGILPLIEMLKSFRGIGYDRVASVEIFRPEYWQRDPFELARDAKAATERVMAQVETETI